MSDVRQEMDQVINELEKKGIDFNTTQEDLQTRGLGDVVEGVLTKFRLILRMSGSIYLLKLEEEQLKNILTE